MVVEAALAGVGRHVLDLCGGLSGRGHDVRLLYCPLRADDAFGERLSGLVGVPAAQVNMHREPSTSDIPAVRSLRRRLFSEGPFDVLHAHSTKAGLLARLAGVGGPAAVVYTPNAVRSMDPRPIRPVRVLYAATERMLAELTDIIIAVSPAERGHLRALGVPDSKLRLVPNAIEPAESLDRRNVRAELGLPDDIPVVGFVGRLAPQKAPDVLIEAFAELADRNADSVLAVVGYGDMEASLKRRTKELGIGTRVRWLGQRPGRRSMSAFDVFCLPSRYEGLPYTLLEAQSAGLPLVTTPAAAGGMLVEHGRNGLLVPPDRPDALASALEELLRDSDMRRQMGESSAARAAAFMLPGMVDSTERAYHSAIHRSKAR